MLILDILAVILSRTEISSSFVSEESSDFIDFVNIVIESDKIEILHRSASQEFNPWAVISAKIDRIKLCIVSLLSDDRLSRTIRSPAQT